jgi:DNA-binding CsgD family transcriptional regulator
MHWPDTLPSGLQQLSSYFPQEKLISALVDSKVGVVICDRRLRYKALNQTVADIHNEPIEAHVNRYFHQVIGGLAEKVIPHWESVFSSGLPLHSVEVSGRLPKRSAEGYWIENLFPLRDEKGRVSQVGCFVVELARPLIQTTSSAQKAGESSGLGSHLLSNAAQAPFTPLSPREREVVRLVAEGKSNKEISSVLAISVRTVETYRARLMLKLNATSVAHLVHYAIRNRLVSI